MANLLGPQVVLRHECISAERPDASQRPDAPAGFFGNLAVERRDGAFARVDATAGQLKLRFGIVLKGEQDLTIPDQYGVNPWATPITNTGLHWFSQPWYHALGPLVAVPI